MGENTGTYYSNEQRGETFLIHDTDFEAIEDDKGNILQVTVPCSNKTAHKNFFSNGLQLLDQDSDCLELGDNGIREDNDAMQGTVIRNRVLSIIHVHGLQR